MDAELYSNSLFEIILRKFSNVTSESFWPWNKPSEQINSIFDSKMYSSTNSLGSTYPFDDTYQDLQSYQNTEFHRFWIPDKKAKQCYDCSRKFTSLWRKHHCRLCGQIFCSACCRQTISGKFIMCTGEIKVCGYCFKMTINYTSVIKQENTFAYHTNICEIFDTKSLFHDASPHIPVFALSTNHSVLQISFEVVEMNTCGGRVILVQSETLFALYEKVAAYLPAITQSGVFFRFVFQRGLFRNIYQAIALMNGFTAAGYLFACTCCNDINSSNEESYHRLQYIKFMKDMSSYKESQILYGIFPALASQYEGNGYEALSFRPRESYIQKERVADFAKYYRKQEEYITKKILVEQKLTLSWVDIILSLSTQVATNLQSGSSIGRFLNIKNYVKFKKVDGGTKIDSSVFGGVMFTQNVSHKTMRKRIANPKVLLLQCAITYERVEGKYIELETLLLQEKEYLSKVVDRLLALEPNIILVQKSVSGFAHQMLRLHGVTLVLNVKRSILDKLSSCLNCQQITSIEWNMNSSKVGTCDLFFTKEFACKEEGFKKVLLGFKVYGLPKNHTVLLRGGSRSELSNLKEIVSQLINARYYSRFELSFLVDTDTDISSVNEVFELSKRHLRSKCESNCLEICKTDQVSNASAGCCLTNVIKSCLFDNINLGRICVQTEKIQRSRYDYVSTRQQINRSFIRDLYHWQLFSRLHDVWGSTLSFLQIEDMLENRENLKKCSGKNVIPDRALEAEFYCVSLVKYRGLGSLLRKNGKILTQINVEKRFKEDSFLANGNGSCLSVLFCCYHVSTSSSKSFCIDPVLVDIFFYGKNDLMLGQFLELYCFRDYLCGKCNSPMTEHVRRYVHGKGCLQVSSWIDSKELSTDQITVTSKCTECKKTTRRLLISEETCCLSYGKYLQHWFNGQLKTNRIIIDGEPYHVAKNNLCAKYECLGRVKQHCFDQSFRSGNFTVKFCYTSIETWNLSFPEAYLKMNSDYDLSKESLNMCIRNLSMIGSETFSNVYDKIVQSNFERNEHFKISMLPIYYEGEMAFKQSMEKLQQNLQTDFSYNEMLGIFENAKRILTETIHWWNNTLHTMQFHVNAKNVDCYDPELFLNLLGMPAKFYNKLPTISGQQSSEQAQIPSLTMLDKNCSLNSESYIKLPSLPHLMSPHDMNSFEIDEHDFGSIISNCLVSESYWKLIEEHHSSTKKLKNFIRSSDLDLSHDALHDEDKGQKSRLHFEICFQSEAAQIICKIYHAAEFDLKRKETFLSPSSDFYQPTIIFAESLRKTIQWDARGGKSGLKFYKTMDGRFVLKEMTKGDLTFFENFAPSYLNYVKRCINDNRSTLLAKILGVFRISIRKKDSIQEQSLLVMENVFYGVDINDKFDLKGSKRNRLANTESQNGDVVLLDENLIKMSRSNPLYISLSSKTELRQLINEDSSFLEQNGIIDYSLLVGLDQKNNRLILGIIDYLRAFTFEKRLESIVKQSGILGGQGKLPTVIAPQRYKQRFTDAMERYFLAVPSDETSKK